MCNSCIPWNLWIVKEGGWLRSMLPEDVNAFRSSTLPVVPATTMNDLYQTKNEMQL